MRKTSKRNVTAFSITTFVLLALYSVLLFTVLLWSVFTSLRQNDMFRASPVSLSGFTFANYGNVASAMEIRVSSATKVSYVNLLGMFEYSFLYAGGGALIQAFVTATVAYCTAKYKSVASSIIRNVVLVTLIIPIVGSLPSTIDFLTRLHLYDNIIGIFLMRISFCNTYYLIFYAAFSRLSWEYAESAFMDGASHLRVYFSIMLPLVKTLVATVFIIFFIYSWNDYQTPYMLLPSMPTAALGLFHFFQNINIENIPEKMAGGVLVFLPVFIVFVLFRNKIMGDLTEGGIKG